MDSSTRDTPSTDAVEFVRFCYRRRRVGWPELYDEMCAVASRGLFRGWGNDELSAQGIGFSLFELNGLAALVSRVQAEEQQRRMVERAAHREAAHREALAAAATIQEQSDEVPESAPTIRFARAGAGAGA
jgi:hypothetical protein